MSCARTVEQALANDQNRSDLWHNWIQKLMRVKQEKGEKRGEEVELQKSVLNRDRGRPEEEGVKGVS